MSGNGKVAMITGAGSGVGRSVALAMMKEGYSVVLAGRRQDALDETIALGASFGAPALAVSTDLANPDAVKPWLEGVTTFDGGDAAAAVAAALKG